MTSMENTRTTEAAAILAADRKLRRELEAIADPKLRAECLAAMRPTDPFAGLDVPFTDQEGVRA